MGKWDELLSLATHSPASSQGSVAVAMPLGKVGPEPETFNQWCALILETQRMGWRVDQIPGWGVPTVCNREQIADKFLKWRWDGQRESAPAQWLFWVDSDMTFGPDYLMQMLADVQEHPEIEVLSGTARMSGKGSDHRPVLYELGRGGIQSISAWPQDRLFQVYAVGTFGMLMRRGVFEKMGKPWFSYQNPGYGSDDAINFCHNLRHAGISIWIDPRLPFGHIDRFAIPGTPDKYTP